MCAIRARRYKCSLTNDIMHCTTFTNHQPSRRHLHSTFIATHMHYSKISNILILIHFYTASAQRMIEFC